ncbi:MAG: folate-binding protein YgfZ [Alphaproteobacteria bacterium]|nr:folate-binding protein YgfZ [Alphaproteobacteria bacterium SS10]
MPQENAAPRYIPLPERAVLAVSGEDAATFLQGLITVDTEGLEVGKTRYGCLLTPQGKFGFDFFLIRQAADSFWLETEAGQAADLMKRLRMFKLRSKVDLALSDPAPAVFACLSAPSDAPDGVTLFEDPRMAALGHRAIGDDAVMRGWLEAAGFTQAPIGDYDTHRLTLGIPDGTRDMEVGKSTMLECNIDQLNGIDWEKGCYMGQELTARTRYRGLVKKRLIPLEIDGSLPEHGTAVMRGDKSVGETRSAFGTHALALMRIAGIEDAEPGAFQIGDANASLIVPDWLRLEKEEI